MPIDVFLTWIARGAILSLLICNFGVTVRADHATAGFGASAAGPITTISAGAIPQGKWLVGVRIEFQSFDSFSDGQLISFAQGGTPVHSVDNLLSPFLVVGYGVSESFTLSARLPFVNRSAIREGEEESPGVFVAHNDGDPRGIGDISLFGQYQLAANPTSLWKFALIGGIKAPVGKTDWTSTEGEILDTEHQPGSGSWDFSSGLAVSLRASPRVTIDASGLFTLTTQGENDVDLGDLLNYGLSFAYRFTGPVEHPHDDGSVHLHEGSTVALDFILESNGEWRHKVSEAGTDEEHSGGSLVYLAPGFRISGKSGWSGFISFGLPIIQRLHGLQHETDIRLLTGISLSL